MTFHQSLNRVFILSCFVGAVFLTGCSSDDDVFVNPDPAPDPPPIVPTVTAPANLTGIWQGTMTQAADSYNVAMVFNMPDGASEGRVMGIAIKQNTDEPYTLIDAGYQNVTNENWDYDYLVGKDGSHGTFMKIFEFDKNLVGAIRGSMSLSLSGNTLTGTTTIEGLNEFDTVLNYSLQNAKETTLTDLAGTWSDSVYGWDDAATGTTLTVNPDGTIATLATGTSTCAGSGLVSDVANYNIYILDGSTINTGVTLSNCDTRVHNEGTPQETDEIVDGEYDGMGVLLEDDSGNNILTVILSSTLLKIPSMAIYNELIKN